MGFWVRSPMSEPVKGPGEDDRERNGVELFVDGRSLAPSVGGGKVSEDGPTGELDPEFSLLPGGVRVSGPAPSV